jgi:hypothetical protein
MEFIPAFGIAGLAIATVISQSDWNNLFSL